MRLTWTLNVLVFCCQSLPQIVWTNAGQLKGHSLGKAVPPFGTEMRKARFWCVLVQLEDWEPRIAQQSVQLLGIAC